MLQCMLHYALIFIPIAVANGWRFRLKCLASALKGAILGPCRREHLLTIPLCLARVVEVRYRDRW